MSFLGSIGNLMDGSGIKELFVEVYTGKRNVNLLSDKAFAI